MSTVRLIRLSQGKSPDQAKNNDKTTHETSGESCTTTNDNQDIDQSSDASSDTGPASEEDTHRDLTKTVDVKTEPPDNLDNLMEIIVPENHCSNLHNDGVNDTDTDSEEDTHRNVPKTVDVEARPPNNLDSQMDNLLPQMLYRNLHNVGVNDTDNLAVNGEAEMAKDILNEQLSLNFHDYTSTGKSPGKSPDKTKNSDKTTHETSGESCSTTNNNQDIDQSSDASSDTGSASEEDTHRNGTKTVDVKSEPPDHLDKLMDNVVPQNLYSNLHNVGVNDTDNLAIYEEAEKARDVIDEQSINSSGK